MSELRIFDQGNYRIRVQGMPDPEWSDYYANMQISREIGSGEHPTTILMGQIQDQSALLGVLNRLVDMGYPLLLVKYIPEENSDHLEEKKEMKNG